MANTKKHLADMIIVGGGIAGLTLALLLGKKGLNIHLIEPFPPKPLKDSPLSGRTIALMQSSLNILRAAGASDFCEENGTPLKIMRIIDDSVSDQPQIKTEFDSFDLGLEYFGRNIPNSPLRAHLYELVQQVKTITCHSPAKLENYTVHDDARTVATLDNGDFISAPLLVGADGRSSAVRDLAGIKVSKKLYGQSALTFVINHSRGHDFTSTEFHRPGGPFALVPLSGNQSSVVWVEKTDKAETLIRLPKDAFENALQKATNDILGGVTLETTPQCWPLCAIKAKSLVAPRVALIAEAAHVMSPITAQGLNLSLRDVAALAETVVDAMAIGSDHGSQATLRTYERRRSLDVETRFFGVDSMNRIVSNDAAPIKDTRRAGLRLVNKISPLRTFAMQHGLAPSLDQGRLASGEKL